MANPVTDPLRRIMLRVRAIFSRPTFENDMQDEMRARARAARSAPWIETLMADLRFALRKQRAREVYGTICAVVRNAHRKAVVDRGNQQPDALDVSSPPT